MGMSQANARVTNYMEWRTDLAPSTLSTLWSLTQSKLSLFLMEPLNSSLSRRCYHKTTTMFHYHYTANLSRWAINLIRAWQWPSVRTSSTVAIAGSTTNAQRSAARLPPSSVGYSGKKAISLTTMMTTMMMTMMTMSLSLCGEKQPPISHLATALMSTVPSVVKVGTKILQTPNHIAARTKQSSCTEISAGKTS